MINHYFLFLNISDIVSLCVYFVEVLLQRFDLANIQLAPCEDATIIERMDASASLRPLSIFGVITTPAEVLY